MSKTVVLEEYPEAVDVFSGVFPEHKRVGHGSVTSSTCGKFKGHMGCLETHLHNKVTLDGVNHRGKVYWAKIFMSCDKPSCPACFKRGWAVREAGKIEARLAEASKLHGQAEHVVVSLPKKDYFLKYDYLRQKVVAVLGSRGIVGGTQMFHKERFSRARGWYTSPHFHVLGFVGGGYGCRSCQKQYCSECNGFEAVTRRLNEKDGYIVKVLGKRITNFGTAWYQLNHASYRVKAKRAVVATWFGVVSYRKMKATKFVRPKRVCPLCQHELRWLRYLGSNPQILAHFSSVYRKGEVSDGWSDHYENGQLAWVYDERAEDWKKDFG